MQTDSNVEPGDGKPKLKTFGEPLNCVEGSEYAYNQNIDTAERVRAKNGSAVAHWWKIQAAVLVFQPEPSEWPGVDVLEAICQAEFGSGLTAENLRRIRGKIALARTPAQVDSMTVQEAVNEYRQIMPTGSIKAEKSIVANNTNGPCRKILYIAVLLILLLIWLGIVWRYGSGDNIVQKIGSLLWLGGIFVSVGLVASYFFLGHDTWQQILSWWKKVRGD